MHSFYVSYLINKYLLYIYLVLVFSSLNFICHSLSLHSIKVGVFLPLLTGQLRDVTGNRVREGGDMQQRAAGQTKPLYIGPFLHQLSYYI